jgi:phenylacetate-CoA ligase
MSGGQAEKHVQLIRDLHATARSVQRLQWLSSRGDDMLIVRGVNIFPAQTDELILGTDGLVPQYRLELKRLGHLDALTVHVERATAAYCDQAAATPMGNEFSHNVRRLVGISIAVEIHEPGPLGRSTGKANRVLARKAQT